MRITSREFFSKYYNGTSYTTNPTDFAQNLAGSIMETRLVKHTVEVDVSSYASTGNSFDVRSNRITRLSGNFITDGFTINDEVQFNYIIATVPQTAYIKIIAITSQRIDYTLISGTMPTGTSTDFELLLDSPLTGLKQFYNLIENNDPITYANYIDSTQMGWYAEDIGLGSPRATTFVTGKEIGNNKSWRNGSLKVRYSHNTGHIQVFEVEHEFLIMPYYQDTELVNLQTNIPPTDFFGSNSLKYINKYEFRRVLTDPNSSKIIKNENILGSVGWFNEPFNGLSMPFTISNLAYFDGVTPISRIKVGLLTTIKFTVNSSISSFSTSTNVGINTSYLPTLAEQQDRTKTLVENYLADGVLGVANGTNNVVGSPYIINSYKSTFVSVNQIDVELTVLFTDSRLSSISNYLIACQIATDGGSNVTNDKTMLLCGVDTFEKSNDITDLFGVDYQKYELYQDAKGTNGWTDVKGWVEDSINLDFKCWLDLSKNAYLNDLSVKIVAYNPTTLNYFELENIIFPLSGVVVSGVQTFALDQVRGFNFSTKNDYNILKFVNDSLVGTKQYYNGNLSMKIDWQDWINLPSADTVFYDATKENNGLNENASNYSLKNGYEIRVFIDANVKESVLNIDTQYIDSSPTIPTYNYDLSDIPTPIYSGVIKTYDSSGTDLSGSLLNIGNTTINSIWQTTGTFVSVADYEVIISLEPSNSISKNAIKIYNATLSIVGSELIAEFIINPSLISSGVNYKISSRIKCISNSCSETVVLDNLTIIDANNVSFDLSTSLPTSTNVDIVIKQADGTIRENIGGGVVGDNINAFGSDLIATSVSILNYLSGTVDNGGTIVFDKINYRNSQSWWWTENSEDSIIIEFKIDCAKDEIKIYI